jgi:hypothetical protein
MSIGDVTGFDSYTQGYLEDGNKLQVGRLNPTANYSTAFVAAEQTNSAVLQPFARGAQYQATHNAGTITNAGGFYPT